MEVDFDIYENLPNNERIFQEEIKQLQNQIQMMEAHIEALEADVAKLCAKINDMKKVRETLEQNISELYKTARAEIDRKDKMISELRRQLDQFILRRKCSSDGDNYVHKRPREKSPCSHEPQPCVKKPRKDYDIRKNKCLLSPRKKKRSRSRSREKHKHTGTDRKRDYKSDSSEKYEYDRKSHSKRDNNAKTKHSDSKAITNRRDTNEHKTVSSESVVTDMKDKALKEDDKMYKKVITNVTESEKDKTNEELRISKKDRGHAKSENTLASKQDCERVNVKNISVSKEKEEIERSVMKPNLEDIPRESVQKFQMPQESARTGKSTSAKVLNVVKTESVQKVEVTQKKDNAKVMEVNVVSTTQEPNRGKVSKEPNLDFNNSEEQVHDKVNILEEKRYTQFATNNRESLEKNRTTGNRTNNQKIIINKEKMNKTTKTKTVKHVFENKPKAKARIADVTTKLIRRLEESKTSNSDLCASSETEINTNEVFLDTSLRDLVKSAITNLDEENFNAVKKPEEKRVNVSTDKQKNAEITGGILFDSTKTPTICVTNAENSIKSYNTSTEIGGIKSTYPEINSREKSQSSNSIEHMSINPIKIAKNDAVTVETVDNSVQKECNKHENEKQVFNVSKRSESTEPTKTSASTSMILDTKGNATRKENDKNYNENKNSQTFNEPVTNKKTRAVRRDSVNLSNTDILGKKENENKISKETICINKLNVLVDPREITVNNVLNLEKDDSSKKKNTKSEKNKQASNEIISINKESKAPAVAVRGDAVNLKSTDNPMKTETNTYKNEDNTNQTSMLNQKSDAQKRTTQTMHFEIKENTLQNEPDKKENEIKNKEITNSETSVNKKIEAMNRTETRKSDITNLKTKERLEKKANENERKHSKRQTVSPVKKSESGDPVQVTSDNMISLEITKNVVQQKIRNDNNVEHLMKQISPNKKTIKHGVVNNARMALPRIINSESKNKQTPKQLVSLNNKNDSVNTANNAKNEAVVSNITGSTTEILQENKRHNEDKNTTSKGDKKKDLKAVMEVKSKKIKERRDSKEKNITNAKKDRCDEEVPESDRVLRSAARREKLEKSNEKIVEVQNHLRADDCSGKTQEHIIDKHQLLLTNEFTSCGSLTHEGEIPVLHLSDSDPLTKDENLFDVNLNVENFPPVTSTPLAINTDVRLLQDDLNISADVSKSLCDSDIVNTSAKSDTVLSNSVSLLNTSSVRKRRRVVITWS